MLKARKRSVRHARISRSKLSTTVAPETIDFLERKVASGEASTIAEALDAAIAAVRRLENRRRLAHATAAYFAELDQSENALGASLASAASEIDFDQEL